MTSFDHPSPLSRRRFRDAVRRRATLLQGRCIAFVLGGLPGGLAGVPFIPAQILGGEGIRLRSPNDPLGQCLRPQRDIRRFCLADDKGQRHPTPVNQETPFAPMFSPDPWGSAPRPRAPAELKESGGLPTYRHSASETCHDGVCYFRFMAWIVGVFSDFCQPLFRDILKFVRRTFLKSPRGTGCVSLMASAMGDAASMSSLHTCRPDRANILSKTHVTFVFLTDLLKMLRHANRLY